MGWTCGGSFEKNEVMVDNLGKDCYNEINMYVDFTNIV